MSHATEQARLAVIAALVLGIVFTLSTIIPKVL